MIKEKMPKQTNDNGEDQMVTVVIVNNYQIALLYQAKLESFGIHSNISGYTPFSVFEIENKGIRIQVNQSDVIPAKKILDQPLRHKKEIHKNDTLIDKLVDIYDTNKFVFLCLIVLAGVVTGLIPYLIGRIIPFGTFFERDIGFIDEWINGFILILFLGIILWILIVMIVFTRKYLFPKEK
jgi:hypothetical protein